MSATTPTSVRAESTPVNEQLIERLVERENMIRAYKRVVGNKGAPGVDGIPVDQLEPYLQAHWSEIKVKLLKGIYHPQSVKQVSIPKPKGGERLLGIPTVIDRLIQQALHQILEPLFDSSFSEHSYGFRPGRSAHQAINQAKTYQVEGCNWVVDLDLAKFFDEVHHDILISKIRRVVNDRSTLRLIRRYLQTGAMIGGVVTPRLKGTPQGSPLSPLLSNIMLDELDKELEGRGHSFCRYADDVSIYVHSRKAGERVLESISSYLEKKLRLKVNMKKSAVDSPSKRTFLGYSFIGKQKPVIRVPADSVKRLKKKLKALFRRGRGRNLGKFIQKDLNPVIRGWIIYFGLAEVKRFARELDGWIRRRLRLILWRQWKRNWTRYKRLRSAGLSNERAVQSAFNGHGPWWNSGASHMNAAFPKVYFDHLGLVSMLDYLHGIRKH